MPPQGKAGRLEVKKNVTEVTMGVCARWTSLLISILDQQFGEEGGALCIRNPPESSSASSLGKSSVPILKSSRAPLFKGR
jgi:hypothetical protein